MVPILQRKSHFFSAGRVMGGRSRARSGSGVVLPACGAERKPDKQREAFPLVCLSVCITHTHAHTPALLKERFLS